MKQRQNVKLRNKGYRKTDSDFPSAMKNLYFEEDSSIEVRPPLVLDNPITAGSTAGGALSITNFDDDKVWSDGANLYIGSATLTAYTAITTASHVSMAEVFGSLHVAADWTDGKEIIGVVSSGGTYAQTTGTYDGASKVAAGIVCEHRGILFTARNYEDSIHYKNRIRWSNYAAPQDFDPDGDGSYSSFEDIGDNADEIMQLKSLGNELIIFKRKSVWVASGIASDVIAPDYIRQLTNEYGLIGADAITMYKTGIIFVSRSGLVFTDGRNFKLIDEDLWRWMRWPVSTADADLDAVWLAWSEEYRCLVLCDPETEYCFVRTNGEWNRWEIKDLLLNRVFNYGKELIFTVAAAGQFKLGDLRAPGITVGVVDVVEGADPSTTVSYFRFTFTALTTEGAGQFLTLNTVELYDGSGLVSPQDMSDVGQATGSGVPHTENGWTITAENEHPSYPGWRCFDDPNPATTLEWINATPATLPQTLDIEADAEYTLTKYVLVRNSYDPTRSPKSWTLHVSTTGAFAGEEVLLDTQTDFIWSADSEEFIIP